jgi:hypothetical protein
VNEQNQTGFHPVNIGNLVMGVALLCLVGVWALWQSGTVTGPDVRWLMPIPWVAAGVVGLTASAITGTRRHTTRQTGWVASENQPESQTQPENETEEQP